MTWADKISPSELRIDWSAPAEHVLRLVRVGGAWTTFRGRRLKVLEAGVVTGEAQASSGTLPDTGPVGPQDVPLGEAQAASGTLPDTGPAGLRGVPLGEAQAASGTVSLRSGLGRGSAVEVAAGHGALELLTVQSEGRAASPARDWANGARITGDERFDE